ncbi:WG repeat-containing protein [Pseudochryseolinea flava]|uniref:WG repeat-containing protein n=1 Tax=Pseudochryseolinea flava TaxID=2059302 RepID=A0A364Y6C2_9BACT|nr:WG repeat-containing protein [Pseudochryseolinea flava]RAW02636.1 hypothetical protein DQQ10_00560 [Pseudochryseolinea flava]
MKQISALFLILVLVAEFDAGFCQEKTSVIQSTTMYLPGADTHGSFEQYTTATLKERKRRSTEVLSIAFTVNSSPDQIDKLLQKHKTLQLSENKKEKEAKILRTKITLHPAVPLQKFVALVHKIGEHTQTYDIDFSRNEIFVYILAQDDPKRGWLSGKFEVFDVESKKGALDFNGDTLIQPIYDELDFRGDIIIATRDQKQGILSTTNKTIIPLRYDALEILKMKDASEVVKVREGERWGIVSMHDEPLLPIIYDQLDYLNIDNLFLFSTEGKQGWRTLQKELTTRRYDSVDPFFTTGSVLFFTSNDGYLDIRDKDDKVSLVPMGTIIVERSGDHFIVKKDKAEGVMDLNQKIVLPTIYENVFATHSNRYWFVMKNKKYGLADLKTSDNTPLIYDEKVESFGSEERGIFCFKLRVNKANELKCGAIDTNGKIVVPFKYDAIASHDGNFIVVNDKQKYGAFNLELGVTINLEYDYLESASDVVAQVYKRNGKYGYLYEDGRKMTEALFDEHQAFSTSAMNISVLKNGNEVCLTAEGQMSDGACEE